MKLKLLESTSVAEIVASVGVILSLVFVGLELNEGNRETRATTAQVALQIEIDMSTVFVQYADIWDKVLTGVPLAAGEETRRGILMFNLLMIDSDNRYQQFRSGYLESAAWQARLRILPMMVQQPMFDIWRKSPGAITHDPEFLEILDNL